MDLPPCICGTFTPVSHRSQTSHQKKCKAYQDSLYSAIRGYQQVVQGTSEYLRDYKKRRLDEPGTHPPSDPTEGTTETAHADSELPGLPDVNIDPPTQDTEQETSRRPQRVHRLPLRFRDNPPEPNILPPGPPNLPRVTLHVSQAWETPPDKFGLFRRYVSRPTYIPGDHDGLIETEADPEPEISPYHPFKNFTQYQLANWYVGAESGTVSGPLFESLLKILRDPRYDAEDLDSFSHRKILETFNGIEKAEILPPWLFVADQWHSDKKIPISIPEGKHHHTSPTGKTVEIEGLHYRSIVEIVRHIYSTAKDINYTPYELLRQNGPTTERVYGELFSSPAWIDEHRRLPYIRGCQLERVVAPLMFWSDATHLTNFGTAKLWPIYMSLGSQSKYTRIKPTFRHMHHVAYIPSLEDSVEDQIQQILGEKFANAYVLTHCRRELMHGVWVILLDESFEEAYKNGIIVLCPDGIHRRIFLRIFTYSADYPEKVLLATIRDKGNCPCPRCLIAKDRVHFMGSVRDSKQRDTMIRRDNHDRKYSVTKARKLIYEHGAGLRSAAVERLLKPRSLVPTLNAFSQKLSSLGFDFHRMLVVDFLHEIELGVWKMVLTHFIRILNMGGEKQVHELNLRYRLIPTFGRDTIRRFSDNVADMKKLAARDFEDILQCAIPAFEGLFPEPLDTLIQKLLFSFSLWHGICKLRLHTQETITFLRLLTYEVGQNLRQLETATRDMSIRELPREVNARIDKQSKGGKKIISSQARLKKLNLSTYKFHAMGDYANTIELMGTIESYSTQAGELQHRTVKRRYHRASKAQTVKSLAQIDMQERYNAAIQQHINPDHIPKDMDEHIPYLPPSQHYYISTSQKSAISISRFLRQNKDDVAITDFVKRLKNHILGRLMDLEYNGDETEFTAEDRSRVFFKKERIYKHKTCRVNFTTYDIRRSQDVINPRNGHSDIMVFSHEDQSLPNSHPFWYARVIGIYHVEASRRLENGEYTPYVAIPFLWVRWFGKDYELGPGRKQRSLDRVAFVTEDDDTEPFGFLDPSFILRSAHVIPAFAYGHIEDTRLSNSSLSHPCLRESRDWRYYYVNRFADRDILMRYVGGAIGHSNLNVSTRPSETIEDVDHWEDPEHTHEDQDDSGVGDGDSNIDDYDIDDIIDLKEDCEEDNELTNSEAETEEWDSSSSSGDESADDGELVNDGYVSA